MSRLLFALIFCALLYRNSFLCEKYFQFVFKFISNMDIESDIRESDEIDFFAVKTSEESQKTYIRIEIPVKQNDFKHNFFVHFRKKGKTQWQSSPLIRDSNHIDMHGLDPNCLYEIRVALLSRPKEVSTFGDMDESEENIVIEKINNSNKQKYLSQKSLDLKVIDRFATHFAEDILTDVRQYLSNQIISENDFESTDQHF